jgi:hypothetical protein
MLIMDGTTLVFFLWVILPLIALSIGLFTLDWLLENKYRRQVEDRFTTLEAKIRANDRLWLDSQKKTKVK